MDFQFARRLAATLGTNVLAFLITFVASVVIARSVGPEGRGVIALVGLFVLVVVSLSNLGLGYAAIYFFGSGSYPRNVVFGYVLKHIAFSCLLAWVMGGVVLQWLAPYVAPNVAKEFLWLGMFVISAQLIYNFMGSSALGCQRIATYNLASLIRAGVYLPLFFALALVLRSRIQAALLGDGLAQLGAGVFLLRDLARQSGAPSLARVRGYTRSAIVFGLPAVLSGILLLLQNRIGLWLTSRYLTLSDVGYLSVGLGLVERVLMVPATASNLLFPHVAAQNVLTSRAPQTVWLVRAVAGGLAGLCLGLGLLAGPLIRTLFGSQFEPAVRPFQILLVGAVFLALFQLMNSDLQGRRQSKPGAVVMMIALGVNCWLSWLLLGRYGMNGVAIASSASFIVSALLLVPAYLAASQTSLHSLVIGDGKETRLVRRLWRKALGRTG